MYKDTTEQSKALHIVEEHYLSKFPDKEYYACLLKSFKTIAEAFSRFSLEQLAWGFNGGKDCTVLLHLTFIYLQAMQLVLSNTGNALSLPTSLPPYQSELFPLTCFYNRCENSFEEVDQFIEETKSLYNLNVIEITDRSLKNSLGTFLTKSPDTIAMFIGTRRTDPGGESLEEFQETDTDQGWPPMNRIHPILHWKLEYIWKFLRENNIKYCPLYDKGYTSLGDKTSTFPNPYLILNDGTFGPAYTMTEDDKERLGRYGKPPV